MVIFLVIYHTQSRRAEFFPEWQQQLILKPSPNQEGLHLFKVSLGKAWRRITIPSGLTLESLADAILEAFDFEERTSL